MAARTQVSPGPRAPRPRGVRKSRASIACGTCRARKVRCSVASDGPPCTNCRLDGLECSVPRSRRGRRASGASEVENDCLLTHFEAAAQEPFVEDPLIEEEEESWMAEDAAEQLQIAAEMSITAHVSGAQAEVASPATSTQHESPRPGWTEHAPDKLPRFITPITLPSRRGIREYLAINEIFCFPATSSLLAEIIRGYLRGVHAYYPILDLAHILPLMDDQTTRDAPEGCVSLLTFAAMMFAGIPFVDESVCLQLGFSSQKEARTSLYTRVKLLYDAEIETRCAPVAQALLLLSVWFDEGGIGRDAWYWTACLAHLVEKAEAWRFLGTGPNAVMTRTLWWCVLVRDVHVALVVRQPSRLYRLHRLVAPPEISDIACITLDTIGESTRGVSPAQDYRRASSFLLNIKLAQITARILQNDPEQAPRGSSPGNFDLTACEQDLAGWSAQFSSVFPDAKQRRQRADRETGPIITVSLMLHDATLNALYLPQIYLSRGASRNSIPGILSYASKMRRAAARTAILAEEALASEWADIIPTQFFTAIVPAAPVHILDLKSPRADLQSASRRSLWACLRLLRHLEARFDLAAHLRKDIQGTLSKLNLSLDEEPGGPGGGPLHAAVDGSGASLVTPEGCEAFFIHIGDPLDDECWAGTPLAASPGRCMSVRPSPSVRPDTPGFSRAGSRTGLLAEFGHVEMTPGLGATPDSRMFHQELQSWFEDMMVVGQAGEPTIPS